MIVKRDFQHDFAFERKIIRLAIFLAIFVVTGSFILRFGRWEAQWLVLAGLLGMLMGVVGMGSYLWIRYFSMPEVEEKDQVNQEFGEQDEKIAGANAQIEHLEADRILLDNQEQSQLSHRNGQYQAQLAEFADGRTFAEIEFRQSSQLALRQLQNAHLRGELLAERLIEAQIPGIESSLIEKLAKKQIVTANELIPEWLEQAQLTVPQVNLLLAWRKEIEAHARSAHPIVLPPSEAAQINQEYEEKIAQIDRDEMLAKATLEKDFFEIRDQTAKQRERNKNMLVSARSALRGLEEKKNTLQKKAASYHQITFRRYFSLALGSAFGTGRVWKSGLVHILILGLLLFQVMMSIWVTQDLSKASREAAPTLIPPTGTELPPSQVCLPTGTLRQTGVVSRVLDGDTIEVLIEAEAVRVRYIGIDAPEPDQNLGGISLNWNIQLVAGKEVLLISDVSDTDTFGRLLRYVLVDEVFVNYQMVADGFAFASAFPPNIACQTIFNEAQTKAQADQVGLWLSIGSPSPTEVPPFPTGEGSKTPGDEPAPCSCTANTLNCADFTTHDEAQACYDYCITQGAGDIHRLDGNADGQACEALP